MALPSFDTFSAARALEAAGVERTQAETIASAIAIHGDIATKHDIGALRADISSLELRMDARISSLEARLEARMYRALWIQGGAIVGIITALNLLA